jgi:hypothetical protein
MALQPCQALLLSTQCQGLQISAEQQLLLWQPGSELLLALLQPAVTMRAQAAGKTVMIQLLVCGPVATYQRQQQQQQQQLRH